MTSSEGFGVEEVVVGVLVVVVVELTGPTFSNIDNNIPEAMRLLSCRFEVLVLSPPHTSEASPGHGRLQEPALV